MKEIYQLPETVPVGYVLEAIQEQSLADLPLGHIEISPADPTKRRDDIAHWSSPYIATS